ncbi:MAG: exo-alpha-sialidase [Desulfovibrionaceae bacterium]|jgi:hypothetical protein|nr:exo-alpha-sialidase [Desulfovibrionaceae bacterium]
MPSIDHDAARHAVIDARAGHYLSFPDIAQAGDGDRDPLVVVYRESDGHYPTRQRLLASLSRDLGRTWSAPRALNPSGAHCPRIARLDAGTPRDRLLAIDDGFPKSVYMSPDQGRSWSVVRANGMRHVIPDRILPLADGTLLTTAHYPRGDAPHPATGQPVCEQLCFVSRDQGRTWEMRSVLSCDPRLALCEASLTRLPDGAILALLRENTGVFEPCYACVSSDEGSTWSDPAPTAIIGHRPCLGVTRAGRLLVTYRNVAPGAGTAAWLGEADDLLAGFRVHGAVGRGCAARVDADGLRLTRAAGGGDLLYALRPLTDPATARAALEVVVRMENGGESAGPEAEANGPGFGLRLGAWFEVGQGWVLPHAPGAQRERAARQGRDGQRIAVPTDRACRLRLDFDAGVVTLRIDGRRRGVFEVGAGPGARLALLGGMRGARPGARADTRKDDAHRPEAAPFAARLLHAHLSIREPRHLREYEWDYRPETHGLPDAAASAGVLELRAGNGAWGGDFGYSGWAEPRPGLFLCAYHHADGARADYEPTRTAHVALTRFGPEDFA